MNTAPHGGKILKICGPYRAASPDTMPPIDREGGEPMQFNQWIRQFLRREEAECFIDTIDFPPLLELVGFHTFLAMLDDPEVEVEELFDLGDDNPFSTPERIGVTWMARDTGDHATTLIPITAFALARHNGLGGLPIVFHIEVVEAGDVQISLCLRREDGRRREALGAWAGRCEERGNPFLGRTLALSDTGIGFLSSPSGPGFDPILPESVLDTLNRSFAFLSDPEGWPENLRHRAVLLAGAPGLGKSLAARWLAENLGVTTLWITGGVLCDVPPAAIFDWARRLRPVLLILEDLGVALGPDGDPRRFGDFLGEMDGFTDLEGVGILATTNDLEGLDPALNPRTRPGRFHRLIELDHPDRDLRRELIERRCGVSGPAVLPSGALIASLADQTVGFTGARIVELVDEACSRMLWAEQSGENPDVDAVFRDVLSERTRLMAMGFNAGARSA
jgi:hypothetical protein